MLHDLMTWIQKYADFSNPFLYAIAAVILLVLVGCTWKSARTFLTTVLIIVFLAVVSMAFAAAILHGIKLLGYY